MVDYLTHQHHAHTVIRYNGGAQAAHNVVTPDGKHHTFSQFGSGAFIPHTRTHLSRFMLVDPLAMLAEERHLCEVGVLNAFQRTTLDRQALIITPFQQAANRLKELSRADKRHGSCGMGIGETMADFLAHGVENVVQAGDLCDKPQLHRKLKFLHQAKYSEIVDLTDHIPSSEHKQAALDVFYQPDIIEACMEVYAYFADLIQLVDMDYLDGLLQQAGTVIFEGAQGVLLDEWYGFHPYTTWSTTRLVNAEQLLYEVGYGGRITRLGVVRAYATRHGAGPFVTEDADLTALLPDVHNASNPWQQDFRVGYFDAVATHYAIEVVQNLDCLAVTHLDRLSDIPEWRICNSYALDTAPAPRYFDYQADGTIKAIRVHSPPDLAHQAALTSLLQGCQPHYQSIERREHIYLEVLADILGLPIGLFSLGMTRSHKHQLPMWRGRFI